MTTLNVKIDKQSRQKYRLMEREITFEALRKRIISAEGVASLKKAASSARKIGLSKMTLKEINKEIKSTRNAKNRS